MIGRPIRGHGGDRAGALVSAVAFTLVVALLGGLLVLVVTTRPSPTGGGASAPAPSASAVRFFYPDVRPAPPIDLIDPESRPFSLASLRGQQVLVFFGYTHCPDVCPVTTGTIGEVLAKVGGGVHAVFVTIDPERDTPAWLAEYVRFLPAGFTAVTGTAAQIRTAADAWGVKYARVETNSKDAYAMSHTADVFLVDAAGELRAHFPFGTDSGTIIRVLQTVAASTPSAIPSAPTAAPSAAGATAPTAGADARPSPAGGLRPEVVSTSVWAGASSPVILALNDPAGRLDDPSIRATVQLLTAGGQAAGPVVEATAVRPPGVNRVSYVASLDIPGSGGWSLDVRAFVAGSVLDGSVGLTALDPGSSAAVGAQAPTVHTPTIADDGGNIRSITTAPQPDLRLSQRSTSDLLAAHVPFVLVIDSDRFRVSQACGKAIAMARYLADRWTDVGFVHLEPFVYTLVMDTPVLSGDIANPSLNQVAQAWGVGGSPWGPLSMPWLFVVDGTGVVRAKYQGLMGSDDVDVMLALIAAGTGSGATP